MSRVSRAGGSRAIRAVGPLLPQRRGRLRVRDWLRVVGLLVWLPVQPVSAFGDAFENALGGVGEGTTASLNSAIVGPDEAIILLIETVQVDAEPDLSPLRQDFELLDRSRRERTVWFDGARVPYVEWELELRPRDTGIYTIPAIRVGRGETPLLSLTVTDAPMLARDLLYVEAELDTSRPYVQSQATLTVRVHQAVPVAGGTLARPGGAGLHVEPLDENSFRRRGRDGRDYLVLERRFAVVPQESGMLTLGPIELVARVAADPLLPEAVGPPRILLRRSAPLTLDVRPGLGTGDWWLPATAVEIRREPAADAAAPSVGAPIVREFTIRAEGVDATQLPELPVPDLPNLEIYREVVDSTTGVSGARLTATRTERWTLLSREAQTLRLPPVVVPWFDVDAEVAREARLPAEPIAITPAFGEPAPSGSSRADDFDAGAVDGDEPVEPRSLDPSDVTIGPAPASANLPLALIAIVLIGLAVRRLRSARPITHDRPESPGSTADEYDDGRGDADPPAESASSARHDAPARMMRVRAEPANRDVGEASGMHDAHARGEASSQHAAMMSASDVADRDAASDGSPVVPPDDCLGDDRSLLQLAAERWPDRPPRNLQALACRLEDPALARRLRQLDASIYGPSTPRRLSEHERERLRSAIRRRPRRQRRAERDGLPPL